MHLLRSLVLIVCLMITGLLGQPVAAGGKHALLIGNSDYREVSSEANWSRLPNPANDVALVAQSLRSVGFEVTVVSNGTWQQMRDAAEQFGRTAQDADLVLFYYAGHGFEYDRRNYLVPVDAPLRTSADDLRSTFIEFESLADRLTNEGTTIFMLDACRTVGNVTSSASTESAVTRSAPTPVIIEQTTRQSSPSAGVREYDFEPGASVAVLYSTGRGIPAYDSAPPPEDISPFAIEVANLVKVPEVDVSLVFNAIRQGVFERTRDYWPPQVPFTYNSLRPGTFFADAAPDVAISEGLASSGQPSQTSISGGSAERPLTRGSNSPRAGSDNEGLRPIDISLEDLQRIDGPILIVRVLSQHTLSDIRALVDARDPLATYFLGYMQRYGLGVEKDLDAARQTLEIAAAQGTPYAQLELGDFLRLNGSGPEDYARSVELYAAAADQGFAKAQAQYGRVLIGGVMVEKSEANDAAGREQLQRAADAGYAYAFYGLWTASSDEAESQIWVDRLRSLSAQGRTDADQQLCAILVRDQDFASAVPYCEVAAREGYPDAFGYLARAANEGWTGERSIDDARFWMRQALSRGDLTPGLCAQMISLQYELAVETNTLSAARLLNCSRSQSRQLAADSATLN